jgi:hypothetical protein
MQVASHPIQALRTKPFQKIVQPLHSSQNTTKSSQPLAQKKDSVAFVPSTSSPHFQGLTASLRGRHWLSGDGFKDLVMHQKHQRGHEGVGVLPVPIVHLFANNPKQAFAFFNALSAELKQLTLMSQKVFTVSLNAISTQDKPIAIQLAFEDIGAYGQVYKVSVPTRNPREPIKHYALKVYHLDADNLQTFCQNWPKQNIHKDYPGPTVHGTLHEQASGLFFSNEPIADLARFHVGNPIQGWALSEWVDYQADSASRPGPKLHEKVKNLTIGDDKDDNHKGNIRVDLGGIYKPKPKSNHSDPTLEDADKTPALHIELFQARTRPKWHAFAELDENMLAEGFDLLIQHLKHQPRPAKLSLKAFDEAHEYSQALKQIQRLPQDTEKLKVFQKLADLNRPELNPILFRLVGYLPASERLTAMCKLLPLVAPETPVHLRESISYCLSELTPEERQQFNQKAFDGIHQQTQAQSIASQPRLYELTRTGKQ